MSAATDAIVTMDAMSRAELLQVAIAAVTQVHTDDYFEFATELVEQMAKEHREKLLDALVEADF